MSTTALVTGHTQSTVTLWITSCGSCGVIYAFPQDLKDRRYKDGQTFWCPNGHGSSWTETEVQRQRKRAEQAENALKWSRLSTQAARDQAQAAEHSARAYKGHLTRMRRSVAAGRCPVAGCRRTFSNVVAHIEGQHPTWAHEHPEVLS